MLIMTTNHIERPDSALIRPGHVNRKVKFRLANKNTINGLFRLMLPSQMAKVTRLRARLTKLSTRGMRLSSSLQMTLLAGYRSRSSARQRSPRF